MQLITVVMYPFNQLFGRCLRGFGKSELKRENIFGLGFVVIVKLFLEGFSYVLKVPLVERYVLSEHLACLAENLG